MMFSIFPSSIRFLNARVTSFAPSAVSLTAEKPRLSRIFTRDENCDQTAVKLGAALMMTSSRFPSHSLTVLRSEQTALASCGQTL